MQASCLKICLQIDKNTNVWNYSQFIALVRYVHKLQGVRGQDKNFVRVQE